jgi:hypothetical protein
VKDTAFRVALWSVVTAVLSTLTAIAINFATDIKTDPWIWIAVALLTILVAVAVAMQANGSSATSAPNQSQSGGHGSRNYQAGRDINIDDTRKNRSQCCEGRVKIVAMTP